MRTLESIERNIRRGDLRGPLSITQDVIDEHRNLSGKSADVRALERLGAIEKEMRAAARAGGTKKLRELLAEKTRQAQGLSFPATAKARRIDPPGKGEEDRLAEHAKRLNTVVIKQGKRENLLARMEKNPRLRERALMQLRRAVDHQIKLWDISTSLAKDLNLELDDVLSEVQAHSITADTGMNVTQKDLEDFLA